MLWCRMGYLRQPSAEYAFVILTMTIEYLGKELIRVRRRASVVTDLNFLAIVAVITQGSQASKLIPVNGFIARLLLKTGF